ncbi:MAG: multicopper oxidase domain-containing protein [Bacteroidota bacterium]
MKKILSLLVLPMAISAYAQTPLLIPDTIVGPTYDLTMHIDSVAFFPGKKSNTYAYNTYSYLGPTLIFNKGSNVTINVNNLIDDTTTVHWHGIHLPAKWDGGPHTPIMPGANWHPTFKVMDHAATYWYHPHMHMKTAVQAIKGAAGLIIVRDSIEASLPLPRMYGIDDFPVIVQCQQYDTVNQAMPLGMQDSTILVNGARANHGQSVYLDCPAQVIRMRLLNASGERVFNFGLSGNKHFKIIASDGGLLNAPVDVTRIRLAPGERAEIVIDLNGMNGQNIFLMSYASELAMGIQGGPTMPMPSGPPMDSPLNGIDFNIMQLRVGPQTSSPITTIPTTLTSQQAYNPALANTTRTIRFTADSAMVMDGPFYFNGNSFDMMRIDFFIPVNAVEKWKLVNETMVAHPFHIHDVQFNLIDRNGSVPPIEERGRKDVVLIPTGDSVIFVTQFEDFTDTIIPYMFHCHILMHEDAGMMGQFMVVPEGFTGLSENLTLTEPITVYPNPTSDFVTLNLPDGNMLADVRIMDVQGKVVLQKNAVSNNTIDITSLSNGQYLVLVRSTNKYFTARLVKH